jgi:hypothetical protein
MGNVRRLGLCLVLLTLSGASRGQQPTNCDCPVKPLVRPPVTFLIQPPPLPNCEKPPACRPTITLHPFVPPAVQTCEGKPGPSIRLVPFVPPQACIVPAKIPSVLVAPVEDRPANWKELLPRPGVKLLAIEQPPPQLGLPIRAPDVLLQLAPQPAPPVLEPACPPNSTCPCLPPISLR